MKSNKRHQIEDRIELSDDIKDSLYRKSDERCCWCGKKVYFGYGATVDHYIPIKKGGTNDLVNLVMMCEDCNKKKGSKIIPLNIAATYLKSPYSEELGQYFEEYIQRYDYVSRGNLLCCDMYEVVLLPEAFDLAQMKARKHGKNIVLKTKPSKYAIKRAYPDDLDRIVDYYVKYLTKYDMLHSRQAAINNVKFWLRFGAIYFIDNGEDINIMGTLLMNKHGYLSINVFPYYSTKLTNSLAHGMITCIGSAIMRENDLPYIPISVNMLKCDSTARRVININITEEVDARFLTAPYFMYNSDYPRKDDPDNKQHYVRGKKNFDRFMYNFEDVENTVRLYLYDNDMMDSDWLAEEMLDRNVFENLKSEFSYLYN